MFDGYGTPHDERFEPEARPEIDELDLYDHTPEAICYSDDKSAGARVVLDGELVAVQVGATFVDTTDVDGETHYTPELSGPVVMLTLEQASKLLANLAATVGHLSSSVAQCDLCKKAPAADGCSGLCKGCAEDVFAH